MVKPNAFQNVAKNFKHAQHDHFQLGEGSTRSGLQLSSWNPVASSDIMTKGSENTLVNRSPFNESVDTFEQGDSRRHNTDLWARREDFSGIENDKFINRSSTASLKIRSATKRLRHSDYTVGWICALASEMTAAKVMLDELHISLPNSPGDDNAYQLGSIAGHNVVITCMRLGQYGTTSATAVAIAMQSTYPKSHTIPLMVGIGGGVPWPDSHDIRLGDVVISTPTPEHHAVLQYDYGKVTRNGTLEVRGSLNKPAPALLNALNHLKSELMLDPGRVSKHISRGLSRFSETYHVYSNPGVEKDQLFDAECEHTSQEFTCQQCPPKLVARSRRVESRPVVHYGSIASGNCVIKHAKTRDSIAARFGILCFEMEAAGLMDFFPCLVIRGICDYCDSYKNKEWQGYAALAAAATAKELLRLMTKARSDEDDIMQPDLQALPVKAALQTIDDNFGSKSMLKALKFDNSRTRVANVKPAHSDTCRWLLKHAKVADWLDPRSYPRHRGFLWIKGKPGTGKSTIMKYLLENIPMAKLDQGNGPPIIASFFFHARGSELNRSSIGMYRSLLDQILQQAPAFKKLLKDEPFPEIGATSCEWTLPLLEEFFRRVVKNLGSLHLLCLIDALDECSDHEIREVVEFLQDVVYLVERQRLYICFSSRHYPHITVKAGNEFKLEEQQEHSQDIINYLDAKFVIGNHRLNKNLKDKVYRKSGQIFFWVVLVVQMLQIEYDRGRLHNLEKMIDELPSEVDDLFKRILTRDSVDLSQLVTSIQWVLYACRPLTPSELYHGLIYSEVSSLGELVLDQEMSEDDISRYILGCSKGIIEVTMPPDSKSQFIHETVREWLLQPSALIGIWSGFEGITEGPSHEKLKKFCYWYITQPGFHIQQNPHLASKMRNPTTPLSRFSLGNYAIAHLLDHAEHAQRLHISQADFINDLAGAPQLLFIENAKLLPRYGVEVHWEFRQLERTCQLGYILATTPRQALRVCWFEQLMIASDWATKLHRVLVMISLAGTRDSFDAMVTVAQDYHGIQESRPEMAQVIFEMWAQPSLSTSFQLLSKSHKITDMLIRQELGSRQHLNEALWTAAHVNAPNAVDLFIALGADIDAKDDHGNTPLHHAVIWSNELHLYHAARRNNAVCHVHRRGSECVQLLCDRGANRELRDDKNRTPLQLARACYNTDAVNMLEATMPQSQPQMTIKANVWVADDVPLPDFITAWKCVCQGDREKMMHSSDVPEYSDW